MSAARAKLVPSGYSDYTPLSRDPKDILCLPLIPKHMFKYLEQRLPSPSAMQIDAIRCLLRMRKDQAFGRCKGKLKMFVKRCEDNGDFSHSAKTHLCDECRCRQVAGEGTKGDFYGLGPETGHLGVGLCLRCAAASRLNPGKLLRNARREVRVMQQYGMSESGKDYELELARKEAELATIASRERDELRLLATELGKLSKQFADLERPTEYVNGVLMPASDVTLARLRIDMAKALSGLRKDALKMDESNYLHIDEIKIRLPEMMNLAYRCLAKLQELIVAKQVRGEEIETNSDPLDYVRDIFDAQMRTIWAPRRHK